MEKRSEWIRLTIGFAGSMLGLFAVRTLNPVIISSVQLPLRVVCMIAAYWLAALVPLILMIAGREKPADYGFEKSRPGLQVLTGVLAGIGLSLILTLVPHLAGFGEYVSSGKQYRFFWQHLAELLYCVLAVGLTEEFVWRGFIYRRVLNISGKEWTAVIVSSVLFGLSHIFGGNIAQVVLTAVIGAVLCLCRLKIRHCTTLSLIIAHGVYDAMVTLWASLLTC